MVVPINSRQETYKNSVRLIRGFHIRFNRNYSVSPYPFTSLFSSNFKSLGLEKYLVNKETVSCVCKLLSCYTSVFPFLEIVLLILDILVI